LLHPMKLPSLSIRTRILLWHGALLACILTAFGITAYRLNWDNELARMDSLLAEPVSLLHRSLHAQNTRVRPGGSARPIDAAPPQAFQLQSEALAQFESHNWHYRVWNRDKKLIGSSDKPAETTTMPDCTYLVPFVTEHRVVGSNREAYIATPLGDCLLVTISMKDAMQSASRFGWQMFALGSVVLGFGLLVDAWILRRAIRPVELIISAAERISHGNLSARIETEHTSQELGRLTSVLITESQISLERERSSEDYRDTIATCLRSARRMGGLIESLLDLAQIQGDPGSPHALCDLATMTSEVIDSLQPLANTHGIELRSAISAAPCRGNAEQLTQIITNLLSNAIQHNQRGGHAMIETSHDQSHVTLRVSNTGPGIPAADLPHVFERFYRTDTSRNRKTGGAGLGLAISKAIADAHKATLTVTSTPAESTTFTLSLPVH
ncbi:MAG: ATP-binding protein, partial [Verrucomicrobia bacterium]|nr:ATP-binding protein [Verrucomicrobiota bacterium]